MYRSSAWPHMDDRPVALEVPTWVYGLLIGSVIVTAGIGAVLYLPWPVAGMLILGAAGSLIAWRRYTYNAVVSRRILPWYILTIAVLLLLGLESWGLGYAEAMRTWVPAGTAGVVFTDAIYLSVFSMVGTSLFLFGSIAVFFQNPLGSYLAWLLFVLAFSQGVLPLLGALAVGTAYFPGMGMGVVAIGCGLIGFARTRALPVHLRSETDHA